MILKTYKTKKFILYSIIISFLFLNLAVSFPLNRAEAFGPVQDFVTEANTGSTSASSHVNTAINVKKYIKEDILPQILKTIAIKFLKDLTNSTVNWINTGFHGQPLYLENPQSFFTDIAKSEVKTLIGNIGYNPLRNPFGKQYALNLINLYKSTAANDEAYSLSLVNNDLAYQENFRNNFYVGGWDGFLLNTQYPQNNPYGYQLLETQKLALKLAGTNQNVAQTISTALQQSNGFLSPQKCVTNSSYNNLTNQFNSPDDFSFDNTAFLANNPRPLQGAMELGICTNPQGTTSPGYTQNECESNEGTWESSYADDFANWQNNYLAARDQAKSKWGQKNGCPSQPNGAPGLINTTPGALVGDRITQALHGTQDQLSLATQLGNSVSAVLNSLMNHFLNQGLNSLASKVNPQPNDNWDYLGNTLSGANSTTQSTWNSGADDQIVLGDFKNAITQGIADTTKELQIMDNSDPKGPAGITQLLGAIWPRIQKLDQCQPGPDLNWETRLQDEVDRNSSGLESKISNADADEANKVKAAKSALNEFNFAVSYFKDYLKNTMLTQLPDSPSFLDTIGSMPALQQESADLVDKKRTKVDALLRLKSLQANISSLTTQPAIGSSGEKLLIELKKQYDAVQGEISNSITIEDTRNELNTDVDIFHNVDKQVTQCSAERITKGWVGDYTKDAVNNILSGAKVVATTDPIKTPLAKPTLFTRGNNFSHLNASEESQLCILPSMGGYSHYPFINPADYPGGVQISGSNTNIPGPLDDGAHLDTAKGYIPDPIFYAPPKARYNIPLLTPPFEVYNENARGFGGDDFEIKVDCDLFYKASDLDYKGLIPGTTGAVQASKSDLSCLDTPPLAVANTSSPTEAAPGWLGDVDFDTTDNVWLVITGGGVINGRIMGADSKPVSQVFRINPNDQDGAYTPLLAYDPDINKFMVIWNSYANPSGPNGFYGRLVSGNGTLGNVFSLNNDGFLNKGAQKTSSLKYDSKNKKFVLVWAPFSGGGPNLTTIDPNGAHGQVINMTTAGGGNNAPKIAVNKDSNEYCVSYDQRSGGASGTTEMAVRQVNASTLALGTETSTAMLTTSVDIAYNETSGKYLLIYDDTTGGVSGRILNSCNINDTNGDFQILPNETKARVAANPATNTFGIIGQDSTDKGSTWAVIDSTGKNLAKGLLITNSRNGQFVQMIGANILDGTYGVISDHDYAATVLESRVGFNAAGPLNTSSCNLPGTANYTAPGDSSTSGDNYTTTGSSFDSNNPVLPNPFTIDNSTNSGTTSSPYISGGTAVDSNTGGTATNYNYTTPGQIITFPGTSNFSGNGQVSYNNNSGYTYPSGTSSYNNNSNNSGYLYPSNTSNNTSNNNYNNTNTSDNFNNPDTDQGTQTNSSGNTQTGVKPSGLGGSPLPDGSKGTIPAAGTASSSSHKWIWIIGIILIIIAFIFIFLRKRFSNATH